MESEVPRPREGRSFVKTVSSSGSDSSSTSEEERLRRLFASCDGDRDGYLDGEDFIFMCRQLNLEDSAEEIMQQLGMNSQSRISFNDFIRCRSHVMSEMEPPLYIEDTGMDSDNSGLAKQRTMATLTSWPTMSSDNSLGAHSGKPESVDYDSGAQDMSSEPTSLQKLMESHDPSSLLKLQESSSASSFLELANRLHLAALTSLKGEIIELSNRLKHVTVERDTLEKQLNKCHGDKLRFQRECEDRIEQTTGRYEERIVELHSVIAELRKKFDRQQINVIREEDEIEESDDQAQSNGDSTSANENNANESQTASVDMGNEMNTELSRVVSELESAIDKRKRTVIDTSRVEDVDNKIEEKTLQVCREMENIDFDSPKPSSHLRPAMFHPPPPPTTQYLDPEYLLEEINGMRRENAVQQMQIDQQAKELNQHRAQTSNNQDERERLKRKIRELQTKLQAYDNSSSPITSRTSTPTKSANINPSTGERSICSSTEQLPITKVAGLKKLRTCSSDRQVLGPEITACGLPNAKVAEHLAQSLQECSNMQEIVQTLYKCGNEISDSKIREFEIEFERLTSKIDHLKSQNDLLGLTLDESKSQSDRLSVLIGKYESNNTALQLAINYSDQALESYDALCVLLETEQGVLLANCRAAGLGSLMSESSPSADQEEVTSILQRAHHVRKIAESTARHILQRLDRSCGVHVSSCTAGPWEELSSTSRTTSTSSTASSSDADFNKGDEQRLRDYIQQMKNDRASVRTTVLELENVHIDPLSNDTRINPDAQKLDLENAVLMQELMAMKEEKAELKAQNYLLEREKRAAELRLSGKESQEQAYIVQIEHLKYEVKERTPKGDKRATLDGDSEDDDSVTPAITLAELRSQDPSQIAQDLAEALRREKKLRSRLQEMVGTLEKLSKNSEVRHQQSAEFVNDLKRANSALISAFDKAKKKYQSKLRKLETQMQAITDRYETQIRMLKHRIVCLEEESSRPSANETSL